MAKEIAMGFDNSVDYELVWDSTIFNELIKKWKIEKKDLSSPLSLVISTEKEFIINILTCMKNGTGGNYSIATNELVDSFSAHFKKKITLGGTEVRAAYAMEKQGVGCVLHLTTKNKYTRELLPKNCECVNTSNKDSLYPHIIIQYTPSSVINATDIHFAPFRANRLIYSNDKTNSEIQLNEFFYKNSIKYAKVLQIGCFESVIDPIILKERIDFLLKELPIAQNRGTIIYQEMGCFHSSETQKTVFERMRPIVDICSMNEDEAGNYCGGKISLLNPEDVLDALEKIHSLYPVPILVIHSKYWALAYGIHAKRLRPCLKSGIIAATTRFRYGDNYGKAQIENTAEATEEPEGKTFSKEIEKLSPNICCMSSLIVRERNVTTIGLGDTFLGGMFLELRNIKREEIVGGAV